jgi:hypothetical protein
MSTVGVIINGDNTIPKSSEDIKLCSENSFTYLSRKRIGPEFCCSKLIDLFVILRYFA